MPLPIISVDNLGKQYRLGATHKFQYGALRDVIGGILAAPFRVVRRQSSDAKSAESLWALRNVSFDVAEGDVVGIIGKNGAGKSTLLKILSKITEPTEGQIRLRGRVASLLEVGTGFHPELTGRENIFLNGAILGMTRKEIYRKFDEIVAFSEIDRFIDTPVKRYSSGMYVRLAFAVAAHLEPEILVVDEVLAVGDASFQRKCLGKMNRVAKEGRTVLFVSHNMAAVNSLCTQAILLSEGQLRSQGTASEIVAQYEAMCLDKAAGSMQEDGYWIAGDDNSGDGIRVTAIEMMDFDGEGRKSLVATGESVSFRLHYESTIDLEDASFQFAVRTDKEEFLINCVTLRLDGIRSPLKRGAGYVDCRFAQFPLAAGEYYLGVGVIHTMVRILYQSLRFGRLKVMPHLDPQSQRALTSDLAYISVPHSWYQCHGVEGDPVELRSGGDG